MKNTSAVYKPTVIKPTLTEQWDYVYPNPRHYTRSYSYRQKSHAFRILSSVSAFIKLFESLFWLSLLLEATHNEEDNSTTTLTVILATAFVISIITGLMALFGPCFHGVVQFKVLLMTTLFSFIWNIILLSLCFLLDYYKHSGNKDNQTETAFNATIGVITAGALFVTTKKLLVQEKRLQHWNNKRLQQQKNIVPLI